MLEAGRELDVLVAKHVIGLDCYGVELYQHDEFCELHNPPRYSTDMAAAWEVVEKMGTKGFTFELYSPSALINDEMGIHSEGWNVHFRDWDNAVYGEVSTDSCGLSICLAALKAVGYEPKESA